MRAWVRGAAFFGSGVPFRVPRRHVVVFSARKRQNRRFGAGGEGDAAFEFAKRFSRPGLSLGAMVLKDPKPPHLCLRPAPNRNILRFRARFPTRWPEAGAFPVVDKLPHLLSTFRAFENPRCLACLGFLCAPLWCAVQVKMFSAAMPPSDAGGMIKTTHFSVDFLLRGR